MLLLLWHSWFGPDIWYHLTWARSLVAQHSFMPTVQTLLPQPLLANPYWLFQLKVFTLFQWGGIQLVSLWFLVLWLVIALLWLAQIQVRRAPALGALLFLAFVICVQLRFEPRPEVLSYVLLSLQLWLLLQLRLERPELRIWLGLFLIQALWTNCHSYFVLGPALGGVLVGSTLWPSPSFTKFRMALATFAILLIGSMVSPFGAANWRLAEAYAQVGRALRDVNAELMPPPLYPLYWPMPVFWVLWVMIAAMSVTVLLRRRSTLPAILGLFGCALGVQALRNIPLTLILGAPLLAPMAIELRLAKIFQRLVQLSVFMLALTLSVLVVHGDYHKWIYSLGTFGVHLESSAYPIGATEVLRHIQFHGRLFCDSYDGGYIEYQLPEVQVAGDSYFADPQVTLQYFAAIRNVEALQHLDGQLHFDGLLINIENTGEVEALLADPHWQTAFADSHRILFLRAANGQPALPLNQARFYSGEDLTHWTYSFGVVTWSSLAFHRDDSALMKKILQDTEAASQVPAALLMNALMLALKTHDREMVDLAKALKAKAFAESKREADLLSSLFTQAESVTKPTS